MNTFTTALSSLLGVIAIVFSNHAQRWGQRCCKSVQLVRVSYFRNDLLQNPYFDKLAIRNRWWRKAFLSVSWVFSATIFLKTCFQIGFYCFIMHLMHIKLRIVNAETWIHNICCPGRELFTGYSFWDRLRNFLHKFIWIVLSVHKLNKLGKFMNN